MNCCEKCGFSLNENTIVCPNCGYKNNENSQMCYSDVQKQNVIHGYSMCIYGLLL